MGGGREGVCEGSERELGRECGRVWQGGREGVWEGESVGGRECGRDWRVWE